MFNIRNELDCLIKENNQKIAIMELFREKKKYDPMVLHNLKKRNNRLKYRLKYI